MSIDHPQIAILCTIAPHPEGGWSPVLHPAGTECPVPRLHAISLPDVVTAVRWARDHYGQVPLVVDDAGGVAAAGLPD